MTERDDECELGYWLGKPFWGQGLMPEAAKEMLLVDDVENKEFLRKLVESMYEKLPAPKKKKK